MTRPRLRSAWTVALVAAALLGACGGNGDGGDGIELRSSAFAEGATIPVRFSCEGDNVSPPLSWSGVAAEARELALVVADMEAPAGTFHHWIVTGIAPGVRSIGEGEVPEGAVQAKGTSDNATYIGPCPPEGNNAG